MVPERLDTVMPVKWKTGREVRFRVQMTQDGEAAGWLPRDSSLMPSLATGSEVATVKPLATVVAQAGGQAGVEGMAAVSFQPYGSGRVVVIEGSGHWRWAFLPTDDAEHKDLYGRFWNGLLRWLAASAEFLPGQTAALRTAQTTFTNLDTVVLQLAVRDDPEVAPGSAPLMEVRGSGPTQRLSALPGGETPGVFLASCGPLPTGSYVASLLRRGDAHPVRCAFDVQEPVAERLDLRARQGLMRRLSEESEGAVLGDSPAAQIRKAYTDYWALRHPEQFRRTPAWDRTSVLLALAGIMGATWMVRRRGGLV
jgi:hypothetical protein